MTTIAKPDAADVYHDVGQAEQCHSLFDPLYQNAFQYFRMGYGSALAWVLFLYILVLTLIVQRSSNTWVYYEGEERNG